MKVCVICPEIANRNEGAFIGGGVNSALHLSKELAARGHDITIITTPHRYPGMGPVRTLEWAELICLPVSGNYLSLRYRLAFAIKAISSVRKLHRIKKFDIIHVHSGYAIMGVVTAILGRITKVPTVHTLYCPVMGKSFFIRFYLNRINRIVAINKNVYDSLKRNNIISDKIVMIPPGIDITTFHPNIQSKVRENFGISPEQSVLLYVGNLNRRKGIDILLEALAIIIKKIPEIKLFMVLNIPIDKYRQSDVHGAENDMELISEVKDKIINYNLNSHVVPLGIIPNLPEVIMASDFLITPFIDTTGIADFPISVLEAMACGKPVIATKVGGLSEIIHDHQNGLLINAGDTKELVNAIDYLLGHRQEVQRMGAVCAQLISDEFSVEATAGRTESLYKELTCGK